MNKRGFTLIELMIVVAIIAVLALIAIPSFKGFVGKAKRAEAYLNLHALYAAQKAYWAEHGTYSDVLAGQGGIGWKPEGYKGGGAQEQFSYTYGFGHGSEGKNYFTGKLETPHSYLHKAYADDKGFVIIAAGYINGSGSEPDVLSVDQSNTITVVHDALAD